MPKKKATKKPASKPRAAKKPPPITTHEISDEARAQMWVLREEGHSLRHIAGEIGCAPRTVQREFNKDPARHDALVRVKAEERAAIWQKNENRSLKLLGSLLEDLERSLFTPTGRPRKLTGKSRDEILTRLDVVRKSIGPIRMAADSSTKMSQLLSGGPTERIVNENTAGVDPTKMSDDEIIEFAVANDLVSELPAALQERYEKLRGEGKIE